MYVTGTRIVYNVQKIKKVWNALAHGAGVRLFSKMVALYPCLPIALGTVLRSRQIKEDGFAANVHTNPLGEASGPVREKEETEDKVWERSAAVEEALRFVTYLYLEEANGALKNNALHTERKNRKKWVMYEYQSSKPPRVFESPPNSILAALGIMNPEPLTRAVVKLGKKGKVIECRIHSETMVYSFMERKDAAFITSSFRYRDGVRIIITVPRARGSITITLSQANN